MKINYRDPAFTAARILRPRPRHFLNPLRYLRPEEEAVQGVIEADEETGQLVTQLRNAAGEPVYVNAAGDTVAVTDAVKVLLLNAETRREFARHFQPKVEVTYVKGLRIEMRGGAVPASPARAGGPPDEAVTMVEKPYEGQTVMLPAGSIY
jgi:hypothetical protein